MCPVDPFYIRIHDRVSFLSQIAYPFRQRCRTHAFARGDVLANPSAHLAPSRRLPRFERTLIPAKTPAHCKIQIARIVGDLTQMDSAIMEQVTNYCPEHLRL